ncbi:MAG: cell wall hydrolase [Pseudomonadota bacterium]
MKRLSCVLLAALVATSACTPAPQSDAPSRASTTYDEADFACLQEAIYHEASANSIDGGRAVANVILNRAQDPRFPDTVCGVISEGEAAGRCQFSYRCDGRPEAFPDKVKLANATEAANLALVNREEDVTSGALFFHAKWMPPGWFGTLRRTVTLGGNIFYGERA